MLRRRPLMRALLLAALAFGIALMLVLLVYLAAVYFVFGGAPD